MKEKSIYVWNDYGILVNIAESEKRLSYFLNISVKDIQEVFARKKPIFKNYTFSYTPILPIQNYIVAFDAELRQAHVSLYIKDASERLGIYSSARSHLNNPRFFVRRYNIRSDGKFPPLYTKKLVAKGKSFWDVKEVIEEGGIKRKYIKNLREVRDTKVPQLLDGVWVQAEKVDNYRINEEYSIVPEGLIQTHMTNFKIIK